MGLTNYTVNICALAGGRKHPIFLNMFLDDLKKYSNFLARCPRMVSTSKEQNMRIFKFESAVRINKSM